MDTLTWLLCEWSFSPTKTVIAFAGGRSVDGRRAQCSRSFSTNADKNHAALLELSRRHESVCEWP